MQISILTSLILAFLAGFAYFTRRFMGDLQLERPIILGPLVGLVMGDPVQGLLIGGSLELVFMGAATLGGAAPNNIAIGTVLGTAFAIALNQGYEASLVIAIPAALLGSFLEILVKVLSVGFVNMADKAADQGDERGIEVALHLGNLIHFLAYFIPTFLALAFGSGVVEALFAVFPEWLRMGITVAGKMIIVLGFGTLLSTMATKMLLPLFVIGFLLTVYTGMSVIGIAILGTMFGIMYVYWQQARSKETMQAGQAPLPSEPGFAEAAQPAQVGIATPEIIRSSFWRSFAIGSAFNYERYQGLGFCFSMIPTLKKLYKGTDEYAPALRRHLAFFNTNNWMVGSVVGMTATAEARRAKTNDVTVDGIAGIKSAMMGPLAGIGDSIFWLTLRPILGGIAASLALQMNPIAPILFFVVLNTVHLLVHWNMTKYGFLAGDRLLEKLDSAETKALMFSATMVGLLSLGALTGTWLNITTPLSYTLGDSTTTVQAMLDAIMPKMLPFLFTLGVFAWVRKGGRPWVILLTLAAIGLVLGALKILA